MNNYIQIYKNICKNILKYMYIHVHVYTENIQRIYRDKIQCTESESILRLNTTIYKHIHVHVHVLRIQVQIHCTGNNYK